MRTRLTDATVYREEPEANRHIELRVEATRVAFYAQNTRIRIREQDGIRIEHLKGFRTAQ